WLLIGRQQRLYHPAGCREALGVTVGPRGARRRRPVPLLGLAGEQVLPPLPDHLLDALLLPELFQGQQHERGVKRLGGRGHVGPPAAVPALTFADDLQTTLSLFRDRLAFAPLQRPQHGGRVEDAFHRRRPQPLVGTAEGLAVALRVGPLQGAAGEVGRQG